MSNFESYVGDNLIELGKITANSVDLIYTDPPFNSGRNYNRRDEDIDALEQAYEDTWRWGDASKQALDQLLNDPDVMPLAKALENLLSENNSQLLAYLVFMVPRIRAMHRVLKTNGVLFLHCDQTASHYLKVVLDYIFCKGAFRNEIIWKGSNGNSNAKRFGLLHDVILFYSKGKKHTWNDVREPYSEKELKTFRRDSDGRLWASRDLTGPRLRNGDCGKPWRTWNPSDWGRNWAIGKAVRAEYARRTGLVLEGNSQECLEKLDAVGLVITEGDKPRYKHYIDPEGKTLGDIWSDIAMTQNERVNFEGQKPEKLVRRIIESCTNPGDLVLDPFLGSGTTAIASLNLSRRCIGIELTGDTMMAATDRIKKQFPDFVFREIYGHPKDLASAKALSQKDPYLFQQWVTTVCFPGACGPKGADRGKDGRLNVAGFFEKPHVRRALISVKGGRANPSDVQALTAVVDQDQTAVMGIFVCFEEYMTEGIRNAARAAGTYSSGDPKDMSTYGKIQVVPVERFFERNVKLGGLHVPSFVYKDETIDNPRPKERFSQRDLFQEALDILCD